MLRLNLRRLSFLSLLLGSLVSHPSAGNAATIALETDSVSVFEGALVEIRVYGIDFPDGTDGGDFALAWTAGLSFVDLAIEDPPWDLSAFDAAGATTGSISFVDVFSFIDTPGIAGSRFEIATLTLLVGPPGLAQISIAPAQVGWSLAGDALDVGLGAPIGLEILAVPEPTMAALVGLGLALLSIGRPRA